MIPCINATLIPAPCPLKQNHGISQNQTTTFGGQLAPLRASIIKMSQQAIRNKLVYLCLVGAKRRGEREGKRALHEEPALARAPRHFVRMNGGPQNKKVVVHSFDLLLFMLTI